MATQNVGAIEYDARINTKNLKADAHQAENIVKSTGDKIGSEAEHGTGRASAALSRLGAVIKTAAITTATAASAAAAAFTVFGLKTAGDLEAARMGFVTLLGSAEKADEVINQIKKDAKATPFELKGLIEANQALTAVTKNGMRSEAILLDVGKALAASGKGQAELDRMIANLQQIGLTGQITAMDIKQFGMSGVNILEILGDYYGTTAAKAGEMVKDSKDGFGDIEKAFAKAGGAGGKFENAFKNQAGTFNQSVSNMKDSFTIFASDFVTQTGIFNVAKKAIKGVTDAVTNNKDAIVESTIQLGKNIAEFGGQALEVAKKVGGYLMPKLEALWHTIKEDVIPMFQKLWNEVIKPLLPVIGVLLVGAIGFVIDAFKLLLEVVTPVINFLIDHEWIFWSMVTVLGAIKVALMLNGALTAFQGVMAGVTASFTGVSTLLATPLVMPAIVVAAALLSLGAVLTAIQSVKDGLNAVNESNKAFDKYATQHVGNVQQLIAQTKAPYAADIQARSRSQLKALGIKGYASGTSFAEGGMALVGEQGPELVNLPRGSQVIPNNEMDNYSNGNNVNVNVNMDGIMARSRSDLRDVAKDLVSSIDEELRAKGLSPIMPRTI